MKKMFKIIMLIFTAVYPIFMNFFAGAGLIYNRAGYGIDIAAVGLLLILSGLLIAASVVLNLFGKKYTASLVCSLIGLVTFSFMLYIICRHADNAGWTDNYTLKPVSSMYKSRLMPNFIPASVSVVMSIVNIKKNRTSTM